MPRFYARRQQHLNFDASTSLKSPAGRRNLRRPGRLPEREPLVLLRRAPRGQRSCRCSSNATPARAPQIVTGTSIAVVPSLRLRISGDGPNYSFYYDAGQGWQPLRENDDGSILSTEVAGGFVGTVLGPFARQE